MIRDLVKTMVFRFVKRYQDQFRLVDKAGTTDYLEPIKIEGILDQMRDYLSDYDRYRLTEWEGITVAVRCLKNWSGFVVAVATNNEKYANDLEELARAVGMAILEYEKVLYKRYQERNEDVSWLRNIRASAMSFKYDINH